MTQAEPGEYVIEVLLRDEGFIQVLKSFTMFFLSDLDVVEEEEEEEKIEKVETEINEDFQKLLAGFLKSFGGT